MNLLYEAYAWEAHHHTKHSVALKFPNNSLKSTHRVQIECEMRYESVDLCSSLRDLCLALELIIYSFIINLSKLLKPFVYPCHVYGLDC